ncbi:MAG: methylated-DNA--[protein]-cysteine S-methyltransferase [Verrucomicrobiota bacterium]
MASDLSRVADAIQFLTENWQNPPSLESLAERYSSSPSHFQRLFSRLTGLSPKQFVLQLSLSDAKERLRNGSSVLDSSLDSGLSGPGRLHDLFVTIEAATPGEYKSGGAGVTLYWGIHASLFGPSILAATERGLSALFFMGQDPKSQEKALMDLQSRWPAARLVNNPEFTLPYAEIIFQGRARRDVPMRFWVRGTNFQLQVWRALLDVKPGQLSSYGALAHRIGKPSAARAVGTAVGANPISLLIPCHRVLRESGAIGGYHWGLDKKRAMLAWEHANCPIPS